MPSKTLDTGGVSVYTRPWISSARSSDHYSSPVSWRYTYAQAFIVLAVPALITLALLAGARLLYPGLRRSPQNPMNEPSGGGLTRTFWLYLIGAGLVAAGFADYSLISYHFSAALGMNLWLPLSYAIAMAVSGIGSLTFGKLFDRFGIVILVPLTLISAFFAPLVFLGDFGIAIFGAAVWGLGMGVHESIIPAAVARMVPRERRPSAYGIFTGVYGVAWFLGSVAIGLLYTRSAHVLVAFCVALQLGAIPLFVLVARRLRNPRPGTIAD